MSKVSDLIIQIKEDVEDGVLSFVAIAERYDVPVSFVAEIAQEYCETWWRKSGN